jgi:predicted O-linked N-acetylglucosamine transferase (SPINDLY family)
MSQLSTVSSARKAGPPPALSGGQTVWRGVEPASASTHDAGQLHWQAGMALAQARDWPAAARAFARATRAAPADALYWLNLAHAQRHLGRLARAVAAARRCLQHDPGQVLALRLLGECLMLQHAYTQAHQVFAALESAEAPEPESMLQHAAVLMAMLRFDEAAALLLRALAIKPEFARAHAVLASALRDQGLKREAVECLRTAITLDPSDLESRVLLSFEKRHVCDWHELQADVKSMSELLSQAPDGLSRMAAVFATLSLPVAPELQLKAARGEALMRGQGVRALPPVQPASRREAGRRLRVGFLSYDFREHPVSQLIVELLQGLDRGRFEVLLYSTGPDDDSTMRHRVMAAADHFVDIAAMGEEASAQRIRADGVDLLIDLMGHTRGNRMSILARRPAPLQVAYLGYPGSTGAAYIDYLIGDALVTPLQLAGLYSEKLAQMPLTFQPNGRWRPPPKPMSRSAAGLPEDAFVMCAFNHTYKIGPEAFDAWCAVMRDVPRAVLWLKETNGQLHDNVRREAAARGVDPQRILFARTVDYADHFSRLALADVFVDTWPYNAHTTAADALWAGVPVVTLIQNSFASRVAASVLNAAGLAELAFETVQDYRWAITALATDSALLAGYRHHLSEPAALPLFDGQRYTGEFETLLERMWARWCAGLPADHLPAEAASLRLVPPLTPLTALP